MKKVLLYSAIICSLLIIGLIGYFYVGLIRSPVGPPDSFINTSAECLIQKKYSNNTELNDVYSVECTSQFYFIANSQEDLGEYVNRKVRIQAAYPKNSSHTDAVQTNKQCIAGACQPIYKDNRNIYAIDILQIEVL